MSAAAFILILSSAVLHAAWNIQAKRREMDLSGIFWATLVIAIPLLSCLFLWPQIAKDLLNVWPWLLATALCQTTYYCALIQAYRLGEVSAAYPFMRAIPILLTTFMVLLVSSDAWEQTPLLALAIVAGGCLLLCKGEKSQSMSRATFAWALLAACAITGYHWIDDSCIRYLADRHETAAITLVYAMGQWTSIAICLFIFARIKGVRIRPVQVNDFYMGLGIFSSYGLVLAAMPLCENVAWAVAFRQLSIPIAVTLGVVILKEGISLRKLASVACISCGLMWAGLSA